MKKLLLLVCAIGAYSLSFGQAIPGSDMENWRTNTSGSSTSKTVTAPYGWYGMDSVIIGLGESFGALIGADDSVWHANLFEENTIVHSGSHSAKVMTIVQDTFLLPGVLSTAQTHIGVTFFPPGITGVTFTGGNAVSDKPTTVSAWVQYYPGKDSTGTIGIDSGTLNVQALSHIGGKDSVIGLGSISIPPSSSWIQVTVNVVYPTDTSHAVDTMRIAFTSSKPGTALDSSTLYVDEVTMTSVPNPIDHTGIHDAARATLIKVYPNPVTGALYFSGLQVGGYKAVLYSVTGQVVATHTLSGNDAMNVSALAPGFYSYTIFDNGGNAVQRGKVTVAK